jgi:hypothetical protein
MAFPYSPEALEPLPPPYEILELQPGVPVDLEIVAYRIGRITIKPRFPGAPPEKTVAAVRVFLTERCKPTFPHYYDITSARLVAQLIPILLGGLWRTHIIRIVRDAPGPKAHFSVQLIPKP